MNDRHTDVENLPTVLQSLSRSWRKRRPQYSQRRADLQRLRSALKARLPQMTEAIAADFGHRSTHESLIADGMTVLNEIDHLLRHLGGWMRPRRVGVGWRFWPARGADPAGATGRGRGDLALELPGEPGADPAGHCDCRR